MVTEDDTYVNSLTKRIDEASEIDDRVRLGAIGYTGATPELELSSQVSRFLWFCWRSPMTDNKLLAAG